MNWHFLPHRPLNQPHQLRIRLHRLELRKLALYVAPRQPLFGLFFAERAGAWTPAPCEFLKLRLLFGSEKVFEPDQQARMQTFDLVFDVEQLVQLSQHLLFVRPILFDERRQRFRFGALLPLKIGELRFAR